MVALRNGVAEFGWVSIALHWVTAVAVLTQLGLGSYVARMPPRLDNLWLFGLHKSIGFSVLGLTLLRLLWHRLSPPPGPLPGAPPWADRLARATHRLLYVLLIAIPLSGWVASSATGLDVLFAERWRLPAIAPVSEAWEDAGFLVHGVLTKLLGALLLLHVAGAVKRSVEGDGTLRRMLRGRALRR